MVVSYMAAPKLSNITNNGQIYLLRKQMLLHMSHANSMQSLQPLIQADAPPGTLFPAFALYCYLIGSAIIKMISTSSLLNHIIFKHANLQLF